MSKSIQKSESSTTARVVESLVLRGDISALTPEERAEYYLQLCESLGLNAAAQPLVPLRLNGKEILYPTRAATDQLAAMHRLDRRIIDGPRIDDSFGQKIGYCACEARHPNGRVETAIATLPLAGDVAMLPMKLETKAKRRATLSILGLGMLDESEVESIPAHEKAPGAPIDLGRARPVEAPARELPLSVQKLADDLASLGDGLSVEQIASVVREHYTAISDEGNDALIEALGLAKNAAPNGTKTRVHAIFNALGNELADRRLAASEPTLAAFQADLERVELPGEAVLVWLKHRDAFALLNPIQRDLAYSRLVIKIEDVGRMKNARDWLDRAVAEEDSRRAANSSPDPSVNIARDPPPRESAEAEAMHPALVALRDALASAGDLDAVAARWREAGPEVRLLDTSDQRDAWVMAEGAAMRVTGAKTLREASDKLRAKLAGPEGPGPKGGKRATPKAVASAEGAANEAAPSAGSQARAPHPDSEIFAESDEAWEAHCLAYAHLDHLRNGWAKHAPAFSAAGVYEERLAVAAARMQALTHLADIDVAKVDLRRVSRAADERALRASMPTRVARAA